MVVKCCLLACTTCVYDSEASRFRGGMGGDHGSKPGNLFFDQYLVLAGHAYDAAASLPTTRVHRVGTASEAVVHLCRPAGGCRVQGLGFMFREV